MADDGSLTDHVEGLLHEDTQVHDGRVDLTAADVLVVDEPGRLDFGGGELTAASLRSVETEFRDPEDDYAWWHLDAGQYLLAYNESLVGDERLWLQPRDELLERGGSHPSLFVTDLGRVPLSVGEGGLRVKENARLTTLSRPP